MTEKERSELLKEMLRRELAAMHERPPTKEETAEMHDGLLAGTATKEQQQRALAMLAQASVILGKFLPDDLSGLLLSAAKDELLDPGSVNVETQAIPLSGMAHQGNETLH